MRWAVEYITRSGMIGLCIFTAEDIEDAQEYVSSMVSKHGHTDVFNLNALTDGAGVDELYRLFPRLTSSVERDEMPVREHQ